jgi:hypothetical protein
MSDRGHIVVPRDIFDEALLQEPAAFRAWLWLLSEAAWEPRKQGVSNGRSKTVIQLERGQLTHSLRYMAKAWGVTVKRVRTILHRFEVCEGRLQIATKTTTQTGTAQTIITICNYEDLQNYNSAMGTQTGTQRARKGHRTNHLTLKPEERGISIKPELKPQNFTDQDWIERLQHLERTGEWSNSYFGPRPGEPGCRVPAHLLVKPVNQTSIPR